MFSLVYCIVRYCNTTDADEAEANTTNALTHTIPCKDTNHHPMTMNDLIVRDGYLAGKEISLPSNCVLEEAKSEDGDEINIQSRHTRKGWYVTWRHANVYSTGL